MMTTAEARSAIIKNLMSRYGEGEAKAIARIVLEDGFGIKGREHEHTFVTTDIAKLSLVVNRLVEGEPVQYVLGQADFFGLKFKVNPAVLIPRQETEELVAWVLEHLKNSELENPLLLDIGLGSGCIGVTLKKKFPALRLFGLEKSKAALEVANENAQLILGENIEFAFEEGDILNYSNWSKFPQLDIVVSNPPYIPLVEKALMPEHVTAHEPAEALFVSDDAPLLFYRAIADFSLHKLRPGGALFFECNEFNAKEVEALLRQKGFSNVELRKDLAEAERMVKGIFFGPDKP